MASVIYHLFFFSLSYFCEMANFISGFHITNHRIARIFLLVTIVFLFVLFFSSWRPAFLLSSQTVKHLQVHCSVACSSTIKVARSEHAATKFACGKINQHSTTNSPSFSRTTEAKFASAHGNPLHACSLHSSQCYPTEIEEPLWCTDSLVHAILIKPVFVQFTIQILLVLWDKRGSSTVNS